MAEDRRWYLVCYDVRDPDRLRRTHAMLKGWGSAVQYSMFRCRLTVRQLERLRWELERVLSSDDALIVAGFCGHCVSQIIVRNPRQDWNLQEMPRYRIV